MSVNRKSGNPLTEGKTRGGMSPKYPEGMPPSKPPMRPPDGPSDEKGIPLSAKFMCSDGVIRSITRETYVSTRVQQLKSKVTNYILDQYQESLKRSCATVPQAWNQVVEIMMADEHGAKENESIKEEAAPIDELMSKTISDMFGILKSSEAEHVDVFFRDKKGVPVVAMVCAEGECARKMEMFLKNYDDVG